LSENFGRYSHKYREGLISAISAGFFFVLVGAIFMTTPNLFDRIIDFFSDFELVPVPNLGIRLPAPEFPWVHLVVYRAVAQFFFVWGLFQMVILALRFVARSPLSKKAETVGNLVFCFGAGLLTRAFLIETTRWAFLTATTRWFAFWSGIIMLIGVSLIIRAIILAAVPTRYVT